jgi:predicted NAD-dependent protein-ADP-ribosyltransferase YbiA (DUF1768 family)
MSQQHVVHIVAGPPDGLLCARYLSNFAPTHDHHHTYEHLFQAAKIRVAHGTRVHKQRALARLWADPVPRHARADGRRRVRAGLTHNEPVWTSLRDDVQHTILAHRVRTDALFRRVLRWTAPRRLVFVERGTPYWGTNVATGVGANVLGEMLMQLRDDLLLEEEEETVA